MYCSLHIYLTGLAHFIHQREIISLLRSTSFSADIFKITYVNFNGNCLPIVCYEYIESLMKENVYVINFMFQRNKLHTLVRTDNMQWTKLARPRLLHTSVPARHVSLSYNTPLLS